MKERVSYLRCILPGCDNPLAGQRTKYCSQKCQERMSSILRSEECKGVYAPIDWAGGPRGMISESSVKKDESFVGGNDRFSIDDYGIDPEIFAIAEANHEKYIRDRGEYEARVVIDGLTIFKEEYDKHHKLGYAAERARKHAANLTDDERQLRNDKQKGISREYYAKNREYLSERQRKRYAENVEKHRSYSRDYYAKNKNKPNT